MVVDSSKDTITTAIPHNDMRVARMVPYGRPSRHDFKQAEKLKL